MLIWPEDFEFENRPLQLESHSLELRMSPDVIAET